MVDVITSSQLRTDIKRVLNEVGYGQKQYIIERFGEPTAAVINLEDFKILQSLKQQQALQSLEELIEDIRERGSDLDAGELNRLVEKARSRYQASQD